jgi:hypothetical protein
VEISSDEITRGADLPLPKPLQFVRVIDLTICRCAEALTIHPKSFNSGFNMPSGVISVTLDAPKTFVHRPVLMLVD